MVLTRKAFLFFLFLAVCGCLVGLGIYGYHRIQDAPSLTDQQIKYYSEQFLFVALLTALAVFLLAAFAIYRGIRIDKEMDKIIELNRYQDFSPQRSMEKLGAFGEKINTLYGQLNVLGEQKTLKISALTKLNTFLIENIDLPLAVIDVRGIVVQTTEELADKLDTAKSEMIGSNITGAIPEIKVQNIVFEVGKTHSSVEVTAEKKKVSCYPIYNRNNELSYLVLIVGKQAFQPTEREEATQQYAHAGTPSQSVQNRIRSRITRFLGRKGSGRKDSNG